MTAEVNGHVRPSQRFTKNRRCPICGGCDQDIREKGKRCHGFISSNGWIHCTREEHANGLTLSDGDTYAHKANGSCKCGATHGEVERTRDIIEATYDYRDEVGELLFQVVRFAGKQFKQRKPDGNGSWVWKLEDVRRVPYRLQELLAADASATVFVVEGEKDADNLRRLGLVATTCPGGAGKWKYVAECARDALAGRDIVVIPDADEKGRAHAEDVHRSLVTVARRVRRLELPVKDASDWIAAGGTAEKLRELVDAVPDGSAFLDENQLARIQAPSPTYRLLPALAAPLASRSPDDFVSHTIGGVELYRLPIGGNATMTGAPGTGKTTCALNVAVEHARERGPVVFVSVEMDAEELAARIVGRHCGASWEQALTGQVPAAQIVEALALPRFAVLDGDQATLEHAERTVEQMRKEHGELPILVVVDYLQILPGTERDMRARVAANAQAARRFAKRTRVLTLTISQPSRAAGKALSSGELLGADSMTAMAETAEIERAAYVTIALGVAGADREDGAKVIDLNIGKGRFGGGNTVRQLASWGRTGRMLLEGDARSADDVRAERVAQRDEKGVRTVADAVEQALARSPKPLSGRAVAGMLEGVSRKLVNPAIRLLVSERRAVHVVDPKARGGHMPLWTTERAAAAGVEVES